MLSPKMIKCLSCHFQKFKCIIQEAQSSFNVLRSFQTFTATIPRHELTSFQQKSSISIEWNLWIIILKGRGPGIIAANRKMLGNFIFYAAFTFENHFLKYMVLVILINSNFVHDVSIFRALRKII